MYLHKFVSLQKSTGIFWGRKRWWRNQPLQGTLEKKRTPWPWKGQRYLPRLCRRHEELPTCICFWRRLSRPHLQNPARNRLNHDGGVLWPHKLLGDNPQERLKQSASADTYTHIRQMVPLTRIQLAPLGCKRSFQGLKCVKTHHYIHLGMYGCKSGVYLPSRCWR